MISKVGMHTFFLGPQIANPQNLELIPELQIHNFLQSSLQITNDKSTNFLSLFRK